MAISRPLLILLAGVIILGAVVLVTRAGGDDGESDPAPTASIADDETAPAAGTDGTDATDTDANGETDTNGAADAPSATESGPAGNTAPERKPSAAGAGSSGDSGGQRPVPRQVSEALARGKVAVIVLYQPGAADDEATLAAVRGLEQARDGRGGLRGGVQIFTDGLTNAGRYLGVTAALGVSQAPAVAIVRPSGEARLLEGYQDPGSLRQHLADAL